MNIALSHSLTLVTIIAAVIPSVAQDEDSHLVLLQTKADVVRATQRREFQPHFEPSAFGKSEQDSPADAHSAQLFPSDNMTAFGSAMNSNLGSLAIGFGFQKCATTLASNILRGHPDSMNTSSPKEFHYLGTGLEGQCKTKNKGPKTYDRFVSDCSDGIYPKGGQMLSDTTPAYSDLRQLDDFLQIMQSMDTETKQSMHKTEIRLWAIVRDPTKRVISALSMKRRQDNPEVNHTSTDEYLDQRLVSQIRERKRGAQHTMISDGEYVDVLKTVMQKFPKSRVLVVNSDAIDDYETWRRFHSHFGLYTPAENDIKTRLDRAYKNADKHKQQEESKYNLSQYVPSAATLKEVQDYYEPYNQELWKFLGVKPWW